MVPTWNLCFLSGSHTIGKLLNSTDLPAVEAREPNRNILSTLTTWNKRIPVVETPWTIVINFWFPSCFQEGISLFITQCVRRQFVLCEYKSFSRMFTCVSLIIRSARPEHLINCTSIRFLLWHGITSLTFNSLFFQWPLIN